MRSYFVSFSLCVGAMLFAHKGTVDGKDIFLTIAAYRAC